MKHYYFSFFLVLTMILGSGCGSTKEYFQIDQAQYEPAVFTESSSMTTIEIIASQIDSNVEFTSLVFKNLAIPVTTEILSDDKVKITGFIQIGGKMIEDHYQKMTEETNRLYFVIDGRRKSVELKNLDRKPTQMPDR